LPPRSQNGRKPQSVENILNRSNKANVMTLSETPMYGVETVDSIMEDTPAGKSNVRQRLKVGKKT